MGEMMGFIREGVGKRGEREGGRERESDNG